MLAKVQNVVPVVRKLVSLNGGSVTYAVNRLYHPPANWKPPHMNDLPVPSGSWQEDYDRKQRKYNLHLLFGVGFLAFSIVAAKTSGLFFMNFSPPARPAKN